MGILGTYYWSSFAFTAALCFALQLYARSEDKKNTGNSVADGGKAPVSPRFAAFQRNYILVYLLAMFADWLQGPYVYELYVSYGFDQEAIAELFVCGFLSSMVVGTFIGGLADKMGRKNACILYAFTYIIACCTKLFPDYWILMLGRFLSGISTSLLFSVFESWMVCEHKQQGFDPVLMGDTFATAVFGNGIVAVGAGFVANAAANSYGNVAPFVVAILPLALVGFIVSSSWNENYGNQALNMLSSLRQGFELVQNDSRVAALGMAQSCFEGAMYTFVFMWTPALKTDTANEEGENVSDYLGTIFAVFMVCVMVGSSVFRIAIQRPKNIYNIPLYLHAVAFFSMAGVTVFLHNKEIVYGCFLLFECTVGVFWPAYGMIKSENIPEDIRSAVMNIFRIPLNAFVVLLLLKIKYLDSKTVFTICTLAHAVSFLCYAYFYSTLKSTELESREDLALQEREKPASDAEALLEKDENL
jgi:predicted MFS family arabinose efflux permease